MRYVKKKGLGLLWATSERNKNMYEYLGTQQNNVVLYPKIFGDIATAFNFCNFSFDYTTYDRLLVVFLYTIYWSTLACKIGLDR